MTLILSLSMSFFIDWMQSSIEKAIAGFLEHLIFMIKVDFEYLIPFSVTN